ncbi:indole-3-glycerol phosphate synthase TrpC [Candidatus Pacearchaeota archaeon]|nr:indole-3-glycerol phosphate synthase TrpC [Candidatus Pacearchaeota archaeon]
MSMLVAILNQKKAELKILYESGAAKKYEQQALHLPARDRLLSKALIGKRKALIAEFKRASPSHGVLRAHADPATIVRVYEQEGASAISVVTDSMFKGSLADLDTVRQCTSLPVLRKDFIIDKAQIYESRVHGADAVLLIVSVLGLDHLQEFLFLAQAVGMDCLVECHSKDEIKQALAAGASLIGINCRNLRDFSVHPELISYLVSFVPSEAMVVAESGIKNLTDVKNLPERVNGILVGEALMNERLHPSMTQVAEKVRELTGKHV